MEYRLLLVLVIQLSAVFTLVYSQSSPASCTLWTSSANTNYAGGTANSASDLAGCQAACIADTSCVAIDWNPSQASGLRCWTLQSLSGTKYANGNSGITHYDLNRSCLNGGSGTSRVSASFDRQTFQIDTAPNQGPSLAVDGNATSVSCTTSTFVQPWWAVRLDMSSFVLSVKVVGNTQANLLDNFLVGLSNSRPTPGSTLSSSSYILCAQYNGSVAASATVTVSCSSSSTSRPYQYVIIRSSKSAGTPLCLAEVEVNIKTDTVYKILYTKDGSVVSQGGTYLLDFSIRYAALLVEIPCLASNISGFSRTQNCFTWYTVGADSPTNYLTGDIFNSIRLQQSSNQWSTERFLEDTSFYAVLNSTTGYTSIQPVVYPDINFYQSTLGVNRINLLGTLSDPAMFYFSSVTLPNNPITGSCPNVWTRIQSARSSSYSTLPGAGIADCRRRCLVYPNCTGVTIIPSTGRCFLDNSGSSLVNDPSAVYYDLIRTYPDTCTRGCVDILMDDSIHSLFTNCGQCSTLQTININVTDPNAVLQPGVTGESECFTACINNRQCLGFELASDGKCSLSLASYGGLIPSNSTTYFQVSQSACGSGCRDKWDFYVDTSMRGASLQSTYKSERDCRLACQADQYCTKIDWDKTTGSCYFGNVTTTVNFIGTTPGWNHFKFSEQLYCGEQEDN